MLRSSFVKQLKKIGEIPVPEGHLRRNKGVSTYFFDISKLPEIEALLASQGLENKGQVPGYVDGVVHWLRKEEYDPLAGYHSSRSVFLSQDNGWVGCSILRWPA